MAEGAIEREVKLSAFAGFVLPDLNGLVDGVVPETIPSRNLDAVYYDTPDLRLARWGVSLRFRTGDGTGWTVKLPEGEDGPALVRRELPFSGPAGTPPAEATNLVRAFVRRAPISAVARLRTRRRGVMLRDGEGHRLAEVVDDEVTVLDGRRVAARFREVEVELDKRAPAGLLSAVLARLRSAGAGEPDPTPKVVRALGSRATAPPEVFEPPLPKDPTGGEVVRAALARSVGRVIMHDAGIRLGDDPEDVHQARVGTRRLRSDLRTYRPLLVVEWAEPLREELAWLAEQLGGVRDADVLTERLRKSAAQLPEVDAASFAPVLRRLADEREVTRARLMEALDSDRYAWLLDRLVVAAMSPELSEEAAKPADELLAPLVAKSWKRLRRSVDDLAPQPEDEDLHNVRILAKRARYAAEAAAPAFGRKAKEMAAAIAEVQGVLGDQHDAVVAEGWLREAAASADAIQALALGELVAAERAEAARCRRDWRGAWERADRKKLRAWLD